MTSRSAVQIDVVIPATRRDGVSSLLYSLSRGTRHPDLVTIVGNEVGDVPSHGLRVRRIAFRSDSYPIGSHDVVIRRNIGIWSSPCSHVVLLDDDEIAPSNLIETSRTLLAESPCFWGHYRFVDFARFSVDALIGMHPARGRARENPPNAWHLWMSCYAGMFGAHRNTLIDIGGFDLVFCGRHGGEDQNLGRRLARRLGAGDRVFIHEPPFVWHAIERLPWGTGGYTNLCAGEHELLRTDRFGIAVDACRRCPYFKAVHVDPGADRVVVPFEPSQVKLDVVDLN